MTLQELQQTEWYKERPEVIKKAVDKLPPTLMYRFKNSGKQCFIVSYEEPTTNEVNDVTVTVQKTGIGGPLASMDRVLATKIDANDVFGVALDDLEPWPEETT